MAIRRVIGLSVVVGPSTTLLLRRIATLLEDHPDGFELSLRETASALGLGDRGGRNSPMVRSLARCCQFGAAMYCGQQGLAVRRRLPPLTRPQISRLSPELQALHGEWMQQEAIAWDRAKQADDGALAHDLGGDAA